MAENLEHLLISASDLGWEKKISELHQKLFEATYFIPGTGRHKQLIDIIARVREDGDKALEGFCEKFDSANISASEFLVTKQELKKAHEEIDNELLSSIKKSIANVRQYQSDIFIGNNSKFEGKTGVKYTPVKRAGVCVPGASAPLPSTVIMTAVPAQVAGVNEIAVISPPRFESSIHPVILAVCYELGIEEVYRVGGAHGVAALAYGTKSIKAVNKIVGPGNAWVQMAKKEVFGQVDIDSIAGPSEVLILADKDANARFVAADMLSQAEHAPGSSLLFTDSMELGKQVLEELAKQLQVLDRAAQTTEYLKNYSAIVVFNNFDEVITHANDFASEHLEIQCGSKSREIAEKIENAGAIFIGAYTPVAVGDYWAGPSHTLPTGMTSKFFSPLSSNDFVKSTSLIEYDKSNLLESADDIMRLAGTEGLDAHLKSVQIRTK